MALALTDMEGLALTVEVVDFKPGQLAAADAGGVEGFQHGAVAEAEGGANVRHGEQGAGFLEPERLFGQVLFLGSDDEAGGLFVVMEGAEAGPVQRGLRRFTGRRKELLICDWKRKCSPFGHIKNQPSTIVSHQSMCALPPEE